MCDVNKNVNNSNEYMLSNIDNIKNIKIYDYERKSFKNKYSNNTIKQKLKWDFRNNGSDKYIKFDDWVQMKS